MSNNYPPPTEEQLSTVENKINREIPHSFRKFLLRYNSGHPTPSDFRIKGRENEALSIGTIKSFLGVGTPVETINIDYIFNAFRDRIPIDFFPVARDPGGNLIGIGGRGDGSSDVNFWDHEEEADDGRPPTRKNIYRIAVTFDEFISGLFES